MKLTFCGGAKSVTGANYLIETGKEKFLVDCGLLQAGNYAEKENFEDFPYDPKTIQALFVTHAHIDHIGRIPALYKKGFRGKIYSTPPTKDFSEVLLLDSEHILAQEAERAGREHLYGVEHIRGTMSLWETIDYRSPQTINGIGVEFFTAGHILGSASILLTIEDKRIVFSGDLGNSPAPIIGAREYVPEADYCLIESTYGDRLHAKETQKGNLEDLMEDVARNKGTLVIPTFAMERTQKLLYEIDELVRHGRVPKMPMFLDSPLAIKLTNVYRKFEDYFDAEARKLLEGGDKLFNFPGLKTTLTTEESKMINDVPQPKVVIAGSGMSQGGRILHHERRYLPDRHSIIVFTGYQAQGSLGRQILEGAQEVKIMGEIVPVRARIEFLAGYSAHADQDQLIDWLIPMHLGLKGVFVTQGEEHAAKALAQRIKDELGAVATVPSPGDSVTL
jgi:metallo-beta-lactamase family protein